MARIDRQPQIPYADFSVGRERFPLNSQDPVPALGGDGWKPSAAGIPIVTYNTGCHDEQKLDQAEVVQLPFFQRAINGNADAPIITCQESGPALAAKLQALATKTGNFRVFVEKTSRSQCNIVVVPKRYQVVKAENHYFTGRLSTFFHAVWNWVFHGQGHPKDWLQCIEHRGYQTFELRDRRTGKAFNLINAHISGWAPIRQRQAEQLETGLEDVERSGLPTVVNGDFNTNSQRVNRGADATVTKVWKTLAPAGLNDLIPVAKPGGDQMFGKGFTEQNIHMYQGRAIHLPGHPDAESMSEHDPIELNLRFS